MVAHSRLLREPATVHGILFVGALVAALVLGSLVFRNSSYATGSAYVRVNQVGYITGETKRAILMATGSESGATFNVINTANGHSVYSAPIGASQGSWSGAFPDTYLLDLTPVQTRGSYTIRVKRPIAATSPTFKIDTGANLYTQRNWVLGDNAWGSSFIAGAGSTFPYCMQHQVANLAGSLDGTPPIVLGATVDGPNATASFQGLGLQSGMRKCPPAGGDPFSPFSSKGSRYVDNVADWPSVEPADDYTALGILVFAQQVSQS